MFPFGIAILDHAPLIVENDGCFSPFFGRIGPEDLLDGALFWVKIIGDLERHLLFVQAAVGACGDAAIFGVVGIFDVRLGQLAIYGLGEDATLVIIGKRDAVVQLTVAHDLHRQQAALRVIGDGFIRGVRWAL